MRTRNRHALALPLPSLSCLLALAGLGSAQDHTHVRRLSGPLPLGHVGDVHDYTVAPGAQWIVYRADELSDERLELFSVPADGSASPRALCGPLATGRQVLEFQITPDGQRVVYRVDADFSGAHAQLFSAPIDGSAPPTRLHGNLASWAGVLYGLQLSPDSRRALFVGDLLADNRFELFSVPLDGSTRPVLLNPPFAFGGVSSARFSADSTRVVLHMFDGGTLELFGVASDGGPVVRLSGPSVFGGSVREYRLTPDGQRVVYHADPFVSGQRELFSVPLDGSLPPQHLNPTLASGGFVDFGFELDPSGQRVVYRVRLGALGSPELHSAPADGSAGDVLLDAHALPVGVSTALRFAANARVLFLAHPSTTANSALFSVPLDGSAPAVQLGTTPRNSNIILFEPSPDGQRVALVRTVPGTLDVLATSTDGSAPEVKLDRAPWDVVGIDRLLVGATRVAYNGRRTSAGPRELFSAPLDGSAGPLRLLEPSPPLRDLEFDIALAGASVLQRTDWSEDGVVELLSVPLDGAAPPTSLSGPGALTSVGDVQRFERAGRFAVYLADQERSGVPELFSAALDHGGPPRRLNDPLVAPDRVRDFVVSADGEAVVFRANLAGRNGLYLVPSDGRARARKLDPDSTLVGGVESGYRYTPDGRWLVFFANGRGNSLKDVFVVPSDGSAPARSVFTAASFRTDDARLEVSNDSKRIAFCPTHDGRELDSIPVDDPSLAVASLSMPNPFGGTLTALGLSADSRYAVFRADAVTDERYLLYSWPLDGSTGLVALMPPQSGGALDFASAADGRVVFRVLQPQDRMELFSAPVDGSAPPTPLCVLPPSRRVLEFVLSPDGRRVAYRADAETDERYELFSAPCDGSAPSVKLSFASRRDTDVSAFAFTPDSSKVLFLADTLRNEQDDLYVVPPDRSLAPKRLNPSLAPHGTLFDFRCSDDGRFVAYRANHDERAVVELFRVPIEGGVEPVPLSAPPVPGGDVRAYRFVSSSEVLYDADQDEDDAYELFVGVLSEPRRPAAPPAPLR